MILDISIIVAIEQIGPILRGSTSQELLGIKSEAKVILYFTQRVVFALGIGNQQVEFGRIHGPIELINLETPQETFILPLKFNDPKSADTRVQKFGKDVITCLQFKNENRLFLQGLQEPLLNKAIEIIHNFAPDLQYHFVASEKSITELASILKEKLNNFLKLRKESSEIGKNLHHLGTLRRLNNPRRIIGSIFIESGTKILTEEEISLKAGEKLNIKEIKNILQELIDMGYISQINANEDRIYYRIKE